ncbi:hypothetical protein BESB_065550 [Besnoitia besnoiti]|uniref:N-acetyltransferase B complex (NatB) non catalytic subunit n=1 Tax=Besnoitia besnoiti TaxID=94643 RepID=A0A2A9MFT0_BESBE|nr:hypothetical protein BESB_065550 [Besnoitia besnoiti]PFH34523.1 hypothetical protein BESB_065550 [Besnoitia besnoiti]
MAGAARKARDHIRGALDAGDNKQAARLASQSLLKKSKAASEEASALGFKALRAIALARDGQEKDAATLAREVDRAAEKDEETARLCSVVFKELREIYYLPPSRIEAREYPPLEETEEVAAFLDALAASNTGHFDRLLPAALRLFSRFKKPRYLQWALACMLLHEMSASSKATWALAAKLLAKLPALEASPVDSRFPPKVMSTPKGCCDRRDSYASFILRLSVLRQNGQHTDALELLAAHKDLCLYPLEELALRLQLLLEDGQLLEAFRVSEAMLEQQPSNSTFAENCIRLGLSLEADAEEPEKANFLDPWRRKWEADKSTSFNAGEALLALHRLRAVRPLCLSRVSEAWTETCLEEAWTDQARDACITEVFSFVTAHGHDARCFFSLRRLLSCLPSTMREACLRTLEPLRAPWQVDLETLLAAAEEARAKDTQDADAKTQARQRLSQLEKSLSRFICLEKLLHALGRNLAVSSESAAAVNAWIQLSSSFYNAAPERSQAADDLILLAVDVLLAFDEHACRRGGLLRCAAQENGEADAHPEENGDASRPSDPLVQRRFFFAALTLLSMVTACRDPLASSLPASSASSSSSSPSHRVLLQWLTGCVGLIERSRSLFVSSLDVKNVMLYSLGHPLLLPLSDYGLSAEFLALAKRLQECNEENITSLSDALTASFEEGTYAALPDFVAIRSFTSSSMLASLADQDMLLHQSLASSAVPSLSLQQYAYLLSCRDGHSLSVSPSALPSLLRLFRAARCAEGVGATGYAADLTALGLSFVGRSGEEAELKNARLALLPLDKETVVVNLSIPSFSAARVRDLSDPVQRSLALHYAKKEKTQQGDNGVPFLSAEHSLQLATLSSQTLVRPWTPVAPARLVGAEALETLPRTLPAEVLRRLQAEDDARASSPVGAKREGECEGECDSLTRYMLQALYGVTWTDETSAKGNAIWGSSAVRASRATLLVARLVEGVPQRMRLRRLTHLALLPPSLSSSSSSLASVCRSLRAELLAVLLPAPPLSASSPASAPLGACWPSMSVALPTAAAHDALGRDRAEFLVRVWLQAVDLLEASYDPRRLNRKQAKKRQSEKGRDEEEQNTECNTFMSHLETFVRDSSGLFSGSLSSIRAGFDAFLEAGRAKRHGAASGGRGHSATNDKKAGQRRDALDGGNNETLVGPQVLPVWDAFYALASFAAFPLALAAAAVRNFLTVGGGRGEGTPTRQAVLKKVAALVVDIEETQTQVKLLLRAAKDAEAGGSEEEGPSPVWANAHVVLSGETDQVIRFPFTQTKAFASAARMLARDAVVSYVQILSSISKALASRRAWLHEAASSVPQ